MYSIVSRLKSSGRWWNRSFRFPCPIMGHEHELTSCEEFFQLTPKDRQEKSRGRICKTYFKPGGDCLIKDAKCGTAVPMNMLCTSCNAFTKGKRFSPHNSLFCNSKHPAHNKPTRGELTKILEKYFDCPIGQNAAMEQVKSGMFTCTQNKNNTENYPSCTTRSSRTAGTGETIYLTQWIHVGDRPQLVMYDRGF